MDYTGRLVEDFVWSNHVKWSIWSIIIHVVWSTGHTETICFNLQAQTYANIFRRIWAMTWFLGGFSSMHASDDHEGLGRIPARAGQIK